MGNLLTGGHAAECISCNRCCGCCNSWQQLEQPWATASHCPPGMPPSQTVDTYALIMAASWVLLLQIRIVA